MILVGVMMMQAAVCISFGARYGAFGVSVALFCFGMSNFVAGLRERRKAPAGPPLNPAAVMAYALGQSLGNRMTTPPPPPAPAKGIGH